MKKPPPMIHAELFAAGKEPWCIWDYDSTKLNLEFLDSIDPTYFEHFAEVHGELLDTAEKQYAAVALRSAYAHGLETLFALICATLQAPSALTGWMVKYKVSEMEHVVSCIGKGVPFLHDLNISPMTWAEIANTFHSFEMEDLAKNGRIKAAFGVLWRRFAEDVTDPLQISEYNSIKHGLRVRMGGFSLAMGAEDTPGVPANAENMRLMGKSEFGSSFYVPQKLHKYDFRVKRHSVNWNPMKFVYGLRLIAMSINNVVAFAKVLNGVAVADVSFQSPTDEQLFEMPWKDRPTMTAFNMNSIIEKDMIPATAKQEILDSYNPGPS